MKKNIMVLSSLFIFLSISMAIGGMTIISGTGEFISKDTPVKKVVKKEFETKQDKIDRLEAIVKPLPASDIKRNLSIYKKLLGLDPQNKKYKAKVNYYTQKKIVTRELAAEHKKEKKAERERYNRKMYLKSDIEVISWNWGNQTSRIVVAEGVIKNISKKPLDFLKVNVTWSDSDGKYITHGISYIDLTSFKNGQESTFKVFKQYNSKMKKASISFLRRGQKIKSFTRR